MNNLFYFIGFLFRLPLFAVGVVLYTLIGLPLALLYAAFQLLKIPFVFIGAAIENNKGRLERYIKRELEEASYLIFGIYKSMYDWLIKK